MDIYSTFCELRHNTAKVFHIQEDNKVVIATFKQYIIVQLLLTD